jgi:hypothetical protein
MAQRARVQTGPESPPGPGMAASKVLSKRAEWFARAVLILLALLMASVLLEVALRLPPLEALVDRGDRSNLAYRYHPELGWAPVPNEQTVFTASRRISVTNNNYGFRGPEPDRSGKPCILFLGDSFVWGFDVEASERFTEKLQAGHPEWSIVNLGVSGYGTDQEYLVLQKYFDQFRPRLVFLVICGDNDNEDNSWNCRGGYYKPYYTLADGRLKLDGVPVPHSERTFFADHPRLESSCLVRLVIRVFYRATSPAPRKNPEPPTGVILLEMRRFVASKGALFAVGLQQANAELEKFLRDYQIPYVDLTTTNAAHRYTQFGAHWTPDGHRFVAGRIDEFLKRH